MYGINYVIEFIRIKFEDFTPGFLKGIYHLCKALKCVTESIDKQLSTARLLQTFNQLINWRTGLFGLLSQITKCFNLVLGISNILEFAIRHIADNSCKVFHCDSGI